MDARSLLRAKKAEARVEHPYASYTVAGQLRCTVCAQAVTKWDAHILTKQHRQSVQREKEAAAKAEAAAARAKRKADAADGGTGAGPSGAAPARRARTGPAGLPDGFFSAGQRPAEDEDEDEAEQAGAADDGPAPAPPPAPPSAKATGDAELDDFFASLAAETPVAAAPASSQAGGVARSRPKFKPGGDGDEIGAASYEAAPVLIVPAGEGEAEEEPAEEEESDEARRARVEREEREEILSRLEEEERAQEDADSRVMALKKRMELLKRKREAKKS
ncbi:hypothetical protein Q5752_000930 [Cryptotrichosporon argae]